MEKRRKSGSRSLGLEFKIRVDNGRLSQAKADSEPGCAEKRSLGQTIVSSLPAKLVDYEMRVAWMEGAEGERKAPCRRRPTHGYSFSR